MLNITVKNVNEALPVAALHLKRSGVEVESRGMRVLEYPKPVCTTYMNPLERVLFSNDRDANPFFHFMEALWILAGRKDVAWLTQFNKRMIEFSDDGEVFHAPYGYRLRHGFGFDQIQHVITVLKTKPDTRQAVLSIWDPVKDLNVKSKDIPCNDTIFLKIHNGKLDMTVCCRSNDMLWGAYGANVVQFSTLQEYIARMVGVRVGVYRQMSDSFHVYLDDAGGKCWDRVKNVGLSVIDYYARIRPYPLMEIPARWDSDLFVFLDNPLTTGGLTEPYFKEVAQPMYSAWKTYKSGDKEGALKIADLIKAEDWAMACRRWIKRRIGIETVDRIA